MSAPTRGYLRQKTNIITEEWKECDSGAFDCSDSESDRTRNEGSAHESPKTLRALHEPFAVDIGNHSAPAAGDRDTQVFVAADALQGRGSTERLKDCGLIEKGEETDDHALLSRVLVGGYILDDRYEIKSERVSASHFCRFARDRFTAQDVFLKFYSRSSTELEHTAMMHEKLKDSYAVCKLIDILPSPEGLPPCLVFEAGSLTLKERLEKRPLSPVEQQDILHSILRALSDVHGRSVVHGCLDPSHVVWFETDFCWKLVNLSAASAVGDPIRKNIRGSPVYAAPEVLEAAEQDPGDARSNTSSDMWFFGLIAYGVLTGVHVVDAVGVKRHLARERSRLKRQSAARTAWNASADQPSKSVEQLLMELDFVLNLLDEDPSERRTAAEILEAAEFGNAADNDDLVTILDNVLSDRGVLDNNAHGLGRWLICHVASQHLDISLSVERFAHNGDPGLAFYERGFKKIRTISDAFLPKDPVYVLTAGKSFGIRISVKHDRQFCYPLWKIASVRIIPPDSKGVDVTVMQCHGDHIVDALAHVDPSTFDSDRLITESPILGLLEDKYVRLTVHVKLRLGNGFPYDIDAYPVVYLQLRRPTRRLKLRRNLKRCKEAAAAALSHKRTPIPVPQTVVV